MKIKKGKKSGEQTNNCLKNQETVSAVKIQFNLSKDSISCFIDEKKPSKRSVCKRPRSTNRAKAQIHKLKINENADKLTPIKKEEVAIEESDFIKDELNTILQQIQYKGIGCTWKESEQQSQECFKAQSSQNQSQNIEIWSTVSVTDSLQKSQTSTMDLYQAPQYFETINLNPLQYSYDGRRSLYEQGSMFMIRESQIGRDPRTTLMIRNIPNKYTIKDLCEQIDVRMANTYDFLYLPCDIKNQCNVGYGFINFIDPVYLCDFYTIFNRYRWSKFRSEKICNLTYARLQGLSSLIEHFENSKVLNQKDKKYRPIIRKFEHIENLIKNQQLN